MGFPNKYVSINFFNNFGQCRFTASLFISLYLEFSRTDKFQEEKNVFPDGTPKLFCGYFVILYTKASTKRSRSILF